MKQEYLEKFIGQLDGMIGAIDQALVLGERTKEEAHAAEHMRDARLKLVESLEAQQRQERKRRQAKYGGDDGYSRASQ